MSEEMDALYKEIDSVLNTLDLVRAARERERARAEKAEAERDSWCRQVKTEMRIQSGMRARVAQLEAALRKIAASAPCCEGHQSSNSPGQPCDQRIAEAALSDTQETQ